MDVIPAAVEAKRRYANESKRQLADVAAVATSDTLTDYVTELVATWTDRAGDLTTELIKAAERCR